jgi:hypothetical protein
MADCLGCFREEESSGDEVEDDDAAHLSDIGKVAYDCLRRKHNHTHHQAWNVTSGEVVTEVRQTPYGTWNNPNDPPPVHDNWLPQKMGEIISRTQYWCDVTSLGPPDGEFLVQFKKALAIVAATSNKPGRDTITVRLLFGNIVGMPVNCDAVMADLVADIPDGSNIQIWVGAWRKGVSWNHSKIIAVDGKYLHNGGHNLWDQHYLKGNPVHDVSMEAKGKVAHDGHLFANYMWKFIEKEQSGIIGKFVAMMPDNLPLVLQTRVTVSEYPEGEVDEFPPQYGKSCVPRYEKDRSAIPMISMGRYGCLLSRERPSDDAIVAMFNAAKTIIHCSLQDLGPITIMGLATPVAVPGCVWPKAYLTAMGTAMYERGVDIEIALSNPGSVPGGLKMTDALYGNGWTCAMVASEIIKTIKETNPDADDAQLRKMVTENLRVCYIRQAKKNTWADGLTMGNHAKHFIIDNQTYYIGSQNLYICDLAEWGVLVDNKAQTKKCMDEYWNPMWKQSYLGTDCDVQEVMDGLDVDRDGDDVEYATKEQLAQAHVQAAKSPGHDTHHDFDQAELDRHS